MFFFQFIIFCAFASGFHARKAYPNQPKLYVTDGHLHIQMPENKYIQFYTSSFHVNDQELLTTLKGATKASKMVQTYERFISQYHSKMDDIENRLLGLGMSSPGTNVSTNANTTIQNQNMLNKFRGIYRRISVMQRAITRLETLLSKDDCASNPCKNAGVCLDMFDGFLCQCQSGWEGPTCEKDIDECARLKGTDLDCQNGGVCQNLPGSYQCYCLKPWVGIHCNSKVIDCNSGGSEICGHGTCVPQNNEVGYKCICDAGWTTDGTHNSCSVDVDECKLNHPPCSTNPLVLCTNVPGSFVCQHCPPGYTGNGYYCADINECELFNGGCSVSPQVECINTQGSSKCGPCPPGYQGDGKTCTYKGICNVNNGGCNLLARCIDNPATSDAFVQCLCPSGYTGSGIGTNGCTKINYSTSTCPFNPCVNGVCVPNNSTLGFYCQCDSNHIGTYCEREINPCASNPCLNGGTCQKRRSRFVCLCPSGFTGRLCNRERQGCGENIYLANGTLKYPTNDFSSSRGSQAVSCAWTIRTDESMVIQINFTKFSVPSDGSCSSQWFQIHDGKNSLAPPLGRYCGTTLPLNGSVTSTHNVVYFWLRSNGQSQRPEFEIKWLAKKADCGGSISGGSGMIVSPGWPSNYPNNRDCYWHYKVPISKRLLFHVYALNIGHDSNCTGDFLKFYSSVSIFDRPLRWIRVSEATKSELFAYFCNSTVPEPFYSTSYQGYIHFKSNDKDTYNGFQIGYSTVEGIPGCGGIYTNKDGYIQSLEMTSSMPSPLTCAYEIKLSLNLTIQLEIVEMDLEESCGITNIAIYQGLSTDSGLIGKYCGSSLPGPIITFGNSVLIQSLSSRFHKNHWKIRYDAVCNQRFTDAEKTIESVRDLRGACTYHIEQPVGNIILLDLELTGLFFYNKRCLTHYVEVRDGDSENSTLIGRYCKTGEKIRIESSTNYLWIKARVLHGGVGVFTAKYRALDMGCGGLLKKELGTIAFPPSGSGKYSGNRKCRWVIMAPNDKVIQLSWMTFNLEQSFSCTYDHVEVFDNNTDSSLGGSMGKYCGYTMPPLMLSSSNVMTIDFFSDTSVHGDGFLASYTFIKQNQICGANYFTSAGVIRTPGYPKNYPTNRECVWIITVPPGSQIMLNVTDFLVEAYSSCRYDWLEIRNGGTSSSPLIGRFCGNTIPKLIPSHTNKLYLKFNSDMSRTTRGFKIQWSSAATGCGGTLTSPSGSIMSPHYPEPYTRNSDCLWKITTSAGSRIQIIFADIDLEKHSTCGLDFVQLLDGPAINSKTLGKFCSPQTNPVISTGNAMLVRFRSDVSFQGRGFNIQYSTLCKNTLTGFGGVIESPNFPNDYPQDQNCVWDIIVNEKNKINITFSHFALERSMPFKNKSCSFDYVEIEYLTDMPYYDYSDQPQYEKYGRFCGYTNPGLITLNSHHAKIHFVSDSLLLGTGFRLEWRLFGCGGVLEKKEGVITSPNYPKPYPTGVECNWIITVPLGQSIRITFEKLQVEKDSSCTYDFVNLYNGKDSTYPLLSTLCYQLQPTTITSTGNNMFIQFRADTSYQGPGFKAHYKTEPTSCGGILTATSGFIYSPNYPKNYNKNETCEWLINVDEHHKVELEFEDVNLHPAANCSTSYIKVYDGPTQAYPLLETICGNTKPNKTIKSTYEHLFVEFRTNNYPWTSKGFKAKYQKGCGATIKTSGNGNLNLDSNFLSTQTEMGPCSYTIQAEDPSQHVTLTTTFLSNNGMCDGFDRDEPLKIFNGPYSDSPLIGSYCGSKVPTIISDGSALHIEINQGIDLFATYTVLDDQCGGELESQEGFFTTPGWPKTYPNNLQCSWTISLGPGNKISLHFLNFDIPESEHCNTDFLEIRETNATGKLIGVYCGLNKPTNITANGKIYLLFKSSTLDEGVSTGKKGFEAEYSLVRENQLSGPEGLVGSPHYPRHILAYGTYTWLITTKPKTRIEITFLDFFMETGFDDGCLDIPFKIYDGMDSEAKSLLETCTSDLPATIVTSSNMAYISLDLYSTRLESKFLLKWKELAIAKKSGTSNSSACQFIYSMDNETNRTISSPGYPNGYAPNLNCEWILQTPEQYHIKVRFTEKNFGLWSSYKDCSYADFIRVYQKPNKNENWKMLKEYCSNSNNNDEITGTNMMKVEFKTNKYLNGTGFQAKVFKVCGGTLTEPSGYIFYNKSGFINEECQWNISVRASRTIKLRFEMFDLNPIASNNCKNYLMIRNGKFPDSPFLGNGKFCGPGLPTDMESTSNHLYLKYTGQSPVKGFKVNYEEVSIECGQYYQLSQEKPFVEITSPNYPNIPPVHIECVWTIRAPTGEALRVDFEERFDISETRSCNKDYLELRDGGTELSPLIGTYCVEAPSTQFTTDNMLRMKFFTDSDETRNGFKAKVSISYCGGTIRGSGGSLSTNEPHRIQAGSNCTWFLKAPSNYFLKIEFLTFNLENPGANCSRSDVSKVHLFEPINSLLGNGSDLGTFCGRMNTTVPIKSSTNEVIVNYLPKSDKSEFSLRFRALRQTCGEHLTQDSGTVTSPGYPNKIYDNHQCFWKIQVPKGRRISFFINDADFDQTFLALLEYLGGPSLAYHSTIKTGETYETSDNEASILFVQRFPSNKRGFKITFSSDKPTICTGNFNESSGVMQTPSINRGYRCEWQHIRKSPEETFSIKVKIETNDTRVGRACSTSRTGVFILNSETQYLAKFCSSSNNNILDIRTPYAVTNLVARRNVRAQLNYTISFSTYQCGGIIENEEGRISSPNFPKIPKSNMECSWLIKIAGEQRIKINVTDLNLGNDCKRSYLIIYNGNNPLSPRIGRYCKDNKPDIIITQINMALIEYKYEKNADESAKGFSLKYEPEVHGCGGIYQYKQDTIQTPGYSKDYPNNAECLWEIHAQDGNLIKLQFINRFHIEESEDCSNDYVEIFDWRDEKWVSLGKKCGRTPPKEITSTSTRMKLLFRSNDKITGNGFRATWDWHCGGTLEATQKERYLMSPGYPNNKKADCTYDIITKNLRGVVVISFLDFNLGKEMDCAVSNVTIGNTARVIGYYVKNSTYCGINKPPPQRFHHSVRITFKNGGFWFGNITGFKLAYKDDSCGGNITTPTSIQTPSTYRDVMQIKDFTRYTQAPISCTWYITAPSNQVAVLSIKHLGFSLGLGCLGHRLEVFSGLTVKYSERLASLCGGFEENKPIFSSSNTMLVKLASSLHSFTGFQGEIYFTYGPSAGCGGKINLTETRSINAPNNLPNMDCHWTIVAPTDYKVQIEFTKIHISGACEKPVRNHTYFCTCSFIEVRDGGGPFADQMSKLCSSDNNSPRTFTTSWNTAYIRLYSAVAQNDVFSLTLKPIQSRCGPSELTVTNGTQELTSPDYPNTYPSEIKCTWRIKNPGTRGRIFLQFEDLDLLNETFHGTASSSCDSDYLRVSNDPNKHIVIGGYGPMAEYNRQRMFSADTYYQTTFCGKDVKPFDFYSSGNTVSVTFESSPTGNKGRGFKLKYGPLGCNRTILANEGSVHAEYRDIHDCIITITAEKNRTISIYFSSFFLMNIKQMCDTSGLEILENNSTGTELLKTCGFRKPNPVFSSTNQVYLRIYNNKKSWLSSSFNFLFVSSDNGKGCGGKIFDFKGAFTSPMYPNAYRQDIVCSWDVTVPKGYKVALRFTEFDITGGCSKNKLAVTTHNSNYPTNHQFCPEDVPAMLFSDFNLQVTYYSSVNNGGSGWSAQFQAVKEESDDLVWF